MLSAAELRRRGVARQNAGRFAAGRSLLERALARADDEEMRAVIEVSLAYSDAELGTAEDGLSRCDQALARPGVPEAVRGLVWSQIGLLHVRTGDAQAAMEAFERADALLAETADEARGNLYLNRGNVHLQRGECPAALRDFAAAAQHFDLAALIVHRDKAVHNRGYARLLRGDIAGALQDMDAARATLVGLGTVAAAVGDQDRAEALLAAGLPRDAAAALRRASVAFGKGRVRQGQAEALLVLARTELRHDPREARRVARRAMRIFAGRGSDTWAARAEAVALVAEVLAGSRRRTLLADVARVRSELERQRLDHDASMLDLQAARHHLALGDLDATARALAAVPGRDDEPLDNRLVRHEVRAEVARAGGEDRQALAAVRAGLDELAEWQLAFGSLDLQTSFVGHGRRLAQTGMELALADGRAEVVFEWVERTRALATRVVPVRAPEDPQAAADLQRLRELRAGLGADPAPEQLVEHRRLQRRIREHAWHITGLARMRDSVGLADVQAELAADDGLLLAHIAHAGRLYLLAADRTSVQLHELGEAAPIQQALQGLRADLDVSASRVAPALRAVVRASLAERLERLSAALLGPVEEELRDERPVLLVPTGALAGTPWTLLPHLREHPAVVARSASRWVAARLQPRTDPRTAALVAGPGVRRAEEEVRRANRWGAAGTVLTGAAATVAAVSAAAEDADVLHIAAHGRHAADNPLFSGLELADGPWFGYDIDRLARLPETVLLSACEVGRSTVRWGEEAVGMTVAWLHAGARTVVAAPAAVDDDVACEVLTATHARLAAGDRPAYALHAAAHETGLESMSSFVCFGVGW